MRYFLLSFFNIFCLALFPQSIDVLSAKRLVDACFVSSDNSLVKASSKYCVFSKDINKGYIIVYSDEENKLRLFGYTDTGSWNEEKVPKPLLEILENIDFQGNKKKQRLLLSRQDVDEKRHDIPILLTTKWHQNAPYNDMSPIVVDGNIKSLAGCVAIAASQIVYYWHKDNPSSTFYDTPIYSYGKAPVTYSVPAGTRYNWELIKNFYTDKNSANERESVALLTYVVGTSAWLQYSATGTGGQINDVITPFSTQFRLNSNAKYCLKSKYSQQEWEQLLYDNLMINQPILYSGGAEVGGHAVVIDGYDAKLNLFHFNFGWGGEGDGFYTVDDITGMNGYNYGQSCVCDIYPMERNIIIDQDAPDVLQNGVETKFQLRISNNSTLGIKKLYYFLVRSDSDITIDQKESAFFSNMKEVPNDGELFNIAVSVTPNVNAGDYYLVLTDENLRILKQDKVAVIGSTEIHDIKEDEQTSISIHKESGNVLCIVTKEQTKVEIISIDGRIIFSDDVDGSINLYLPHGLYIVNKIKWLQ